MSRPAPEEHEPPPNAYIPCPFCGQEDFDLGGLKRHSEKGHCDVYNETETWE